MKKRWGKPITQVQRFVPQEYAVICYTYNLSVATATDLGVTDRNTIRVDWGANVGIFDTNEKSTIWGGGSVNNVSAELNTNDMYTINNINEAYLESGGKTSYTGTKPSYSKYKSPINLYIYYSKLYKGEKTTS